jgi:hypothetical protein
MQEYTADDVRQHDSPEKRIWVSFRQGWKKPGFFKKKPSPVVFLYIYICSEDRVFRVFSVSRILLGASRL